MLKYLGGALLALVAAPSAAETVVVTADHLLDVAAGRTVDKPAVMIVDGRITTVGIQGAVAIPKDAKRIDLAGKTILPGLIDMHVHLDSDARISGFKALEFTDSFWQAVGVANAKAMLEAGFTTVRNVGSHEYNDVGLKQAIERGYVPGPRVVPATFALGATGGHCDGTEGLPQLRRGADTLGRRRAGGLSQARAQGAQIWRGGDQDLRDRWRAVAFRRRRRPADDL